MCVCVCVCMCVCVRACVCACVCVCVCGPTSFGGYNFNINTKKGVKAVPSQSKHVEGGHLDLIFEKGFQVLHSELCIMCEALQSEKCHHMHFTQAQNTHHRLSC